MKKILLSTTFCFITFLLSAQYIYKIKADSVLITNDSCSAELIIENSTKNVSGFLFNKGKGRTEFRSVITKIPNVGYAFGSDTLKINNWIWNQDSIRQDANAWFKKLKGYSVKLASEDAAYLTSYPVNNDNSWAFHTGKLFQAFDIDTASAANDAWNYSINGNALISRYTNASKNYQILYRSNLIADQWYAIQDTGYIYTTSAASNNNIRATLTIAPTKTTTKTQNVLVDNGLGDIYNSTSNILSLFGTGRPDNSSATVKAMGTYNGYTSQWIVSNGDSVDNYIHYAALMWPGGGHLHTTTALYMSAHPFPAQTDIQWGLYQEDNPQRSALNLLGGKLGLGYGEFGTHGSPTFKPSAQLQINSHDRGFITSRLTTAEMNAISSPDSALFIWNSDSLRFMGYKPGVGFKGIAWTGEGGSSSTGLPDPSANGIVVRTALNTTTSRTLTGTTNEISISNGNGVSGNPTISLPTTLALASKSTTVQDNNFTVQDDVDNTKKFKFDATNVPASTTVTLTSPGVTSTLVSFKTTSEASNATPAPVGDARSNEHFITALAANATFSAPSGTLTNGNRLIMRIKDNGTARTLTWNSVYRGGTDIALPTTTVAGKTMYLGFMYNSADSKWDLIAFINNL